VNTFSKKILIGLLVLLVLLPLGIIIPVKFHAGDAWGEWSVEIIKKNLGFVPKGMEKNNKIWKAPLPNYDTPKRNNSILITSGYYMLSGLIGMVLIIIITIVLLKIVQKRESRLSDAIRHDSTISQTSDRKFVINDKDASSKSDS
jgi:cobalt/nickel transport protein